MTTRPEAERLERAVRLATRPEAERLERAVRLAIGLAFGLFALAAGAAQTGLLILLWDRWELLLLTLGR